MKKLLLAGVAALLLATGTAHAEEEFELYPGGQKPIQSWQCGSGEVLDEIDLNVEHLLSDLARHTITIDVALRQSRNGKRYPVIRYDMETGKLTLNGKRCRPKRAPR
jgi:hypothetical protein